VASLQTLLRVSCFSIAVSAAAAPSISAQGIYKCVEGENVAYQSIPCANGQGETKLMTAARVALADPPATPAALPKLETAVPVDASRTKVWPFRRTLMLGMSDDEVLNLPGLGIPKRITRVKAGHEWREEWSYGPSINGERRLHFVNATLVDVVDVPALQQVASLTLQ
jgi:hypothetical protein